jgi:tripartite-type tricarboxylate transporter receptor subunit TctC
MTKFSAAVGRILTAGALIALIGQAVAQHTYPNKPIRLLVPYAPGGSSSISARLISQKLSEGWDQQVLVENRPGGNTIIATEALAKSAPDGYTILFLDTTHTIIAHLMPLPYDIIKDFAPVATVHSQDFVVVLNPAVAANTLQELIALAKSKPGYLNYASPGAGGIQHLAGELFSGMAGIKMQHIPYKGSGLILPDLISGQVQLSFQSPAVALPHIKSGRIKAVAVSGMTRVPALPQVPTIAESGLPGYDVQAWFGIVAPAGTPRDIIAKIATDVGRTLALPEFRERLAENGMKPFVSTPEQFVALIKADSAKYAKIIKDANIKFEN